MSCHVGLLSPTVSYPSWHDLQTPGFLKHLKTKCSCPSDVKYCTCMGGSMYEYREMVAHTMFSPNTGWKSGTLKNTKKHTTDPCVSTEQSTAASDNQSVINHPINCQLQNQPTHQSINQQMPLFTGCSTHQPETNAHQLINQPINQLFNQSSTDDQPSTEKQPITDWPVN